MTWALYLRDERGEEKRALGRPLVALESLLPRLTFDSYPLLRGVDPYGSTMFNCGQAGHLCDELERLQQSVDLHLDGQRQDLEDFLHFAKLCRDSERALYLWLYGD